MKKLFLAHYSGDTAELYELAMELRLRGIVPWVDKQGGFSIGDHSEDEARRAIREDCFGFLLFASEHVFDRPFIRNVEIDEAQRVYRADPSFLIFAVPHGIGFGELSHKSKRRFGIDLADFHTIPVNKDSRIQRTLAQVASEVLRKVVQRAAEDVGSKTLALQFSTRELFPDQVTELLRIDATGLFSDDPTGEKNWNRLILALLDVKREISRKYGRPRIQVNGSKHLSSAFVFGRVFSPFILDIRQTSSQIWSTDASSELEPPFSIQTHIIDATGNSLFLEIASRYKNIDAGVNQYTASSASNPAIRLQLIPADDILNMDNASCCTAARQSYTSLERTLQQYPQINELHIFAAVPQAFMMMLGQMFKSIPVTYLYEWTEGAYVQVCQLEGRVF